jgi:beta-glucosidase
MVTRAQFLNILVTSTSGLFLFPGKLKTVAHTDELSKHLFGNNFIWGLATGAYQIEGAYDKDGKGPSVWDVFTHKKGKIKDHSNGDIACDFYNKYYEDLQLLKSLNFDAFRFSVSWSRLLPNGTGTVNTKGIDFYNRVIDTCLELGIEPWICLYHWDLPQALEEKGGWANRDVVFWFEEYTRLCTLHFGDRVKNWMVLNEPLSFTSLGYLAGIHAPGHKSINKFLASVHHAALCQSTGGAIIRQNVEHANVGTTFSCSYIDPKKSKPRFYKASKRLDALFNRLFIEPVLGMGYPTDALPFLHKIEKFVQAGDLEKLKFDFDFIGLQNYFRVIGKPSLIPFIWAVNDKPDKDEALFTEMGWEVYPEGIYKILERFAQYPIKEILISENGAAFNDIVTDERIHDPLRIQYFQQYLLQILKAKNNGIPVNGYFAWTFTDNFEWAEGYNMRYGIVYNDFNNQKRIVKDSGLWFQSFLNQ